MTLSNYKGKQNVFTYRTFGHTQKGNKNHRVWRILKSSLFTLSIILITHKVSSASLKHHLPRSVAGSKALRKWRILEKSCIQRRRWLPKFSSSLLPFYLWCKLKLILCTTEIFFGDCTCVSTTNIMSCKKESIFPFQPNRRTFWTRAYVKCAELTIVMNHMRYILPEYVRCTFMRWMRYDFLTNGFKG